MHHHSHCMHSTHCSIHTAWTQSPFPQCMTCSVNMHACVNALLLVQGFGRVEGYLPHTTDSYDYYNVHGQPGPSHPNALIGQEGKAASSALAVQHESGDDDVSVHGIVQALPCMWDFTFILNPCSQAGAVAGASLSRDPSEPPMYGCPRLSCCRW